MMRGDGKEKRVRGGNGVGRKFNLALTFGMQTRS